MRDLTLIIPTYNRPAHLRRLLAYYRRVGRQTRFIVLDSCNEAHQNENRAQVASCGDRFRHVVFSSSMPVATKLFEGLGIVQTPYCAICADDDLIFPDALEKALVFLSTHPDYVCADGIYLNFSPSDEQIHLQIEYGSCGIEASHPGARIFRLFQSYESMFYAVFRTPDLRDMFSFVKDIPTLHYQELFQAAAALIKGKSHRLSEFYAARQSCDPAEPVRDKWQTFYWFAYDSADFLSHYQTYRDDLWRFYQKFCADSTMDRKNFFSAMDMAHTVFFSTNCPPRYFYSRLQSHWPGDVMQMGVSAVEGLMGGWRRKVDEVFKAVAWMLRTRGFLNDYNPPFAVENLRSATAVKALREGGRGCLLPQSLLWIAANPGFRHAFFELCRYLGPVCDTSKERD